MPRTTGGHPPEQPAPRGDSRTGNRPAEHRWPVNGGGAPADDPGRAEREGPAGGRFVVHVPLVAPDLTVALRLARVLAHRSATLPGVDPGGTTVSGGGEQTRAFCDRLLSRRHRCRVIAHHGGPCRP
jgi:hypothetical protein